MIVVCWKWVAAGDDERWAGVSEADRAPCSEVALGLAATLRRRGHRRRRRRPGAEAGLREALAVGATAGGPRRARRRTSRAPPSPRPWPPCWRAVRGSCAATRRPIVAAEPCRPSWLPGWGRAQALGLVAVEHGGDAADVRATRRLDGGRREVLRVVAPAVLSVEGAAARLRRASLPAELAARRATIAVVPGPTGPVEHPDAVQRYRPRARGRRHRRAPP